MAGAVTDCSRPLQRQGEVIELSELCYFSASNFGSVSFSLYNSNESHCYQGDTEQLGRERSHFQSQYSGCFSTETRFSSVVLDFRGVLRKNLGINCGQRSYL